MHLPRRSLACFAAIMLMLSFAHSLLPFSYLSTIHADGVSQGFTALSGDGYIVDQDAVYANAVIATTGTVHDTSSTDFYIGQRHTSPIYYVYRGFLFFDTSSLPDDVLLSSVILGINITKDNSATDFNITVSTPEVSNSFWSSSCPNQNLLTTDFSYLNYDSAAEVGRTSITSPFVNQYINITLSTDCLNKQGITRLILRSDRDIAQTVPIGNEYVGIGSNESGFASQLYTSFNYTTVNTLILKTRAYNGSAGDWSVSGVSPYLSGSGYPKDYIYTSNTINGSVSAHVYFNTINGWNNELCSNIALRLHAKVDWAGAEILVNFYSGSTLFSSKTVSFSSTDFETKTISLGLADISNVNVSSISVTFTTVGMYSYAVTIDWCEMQPYAWTLVSRIAWYTDPSNTRINWAGNGTNIYDNFDTLYYGLLFNKTTPTQMENYIDRSFNAGNWQSCNNVLAWYAIVQKLGIENQTTIQYALGNASQTANCLPMSGIAGKAFFRVYDRDVLYSALYFSKKYYYLTSKWNTTAAYMFFKNGLATNASNHISALEIYSDGSMGNQYDRYYDENGQCASVYMIFYELGVTSALADAEAIWTYVNINHWDANGQYYNYRPNWLGFECEAPYFLKVFSTLFYYDSSISDISRLYSDINTRFLSSSWSSPQWCGTSPTDRTYVCVHMYQDNSQRRLENTMGIWYDLLGTYDAFNTVQRQTIQDMLAGTNAYDPAWMLVYSPNANLYNDGYEMFKMQDNNANVSSGATANALTLMLLQGICPMNTSLAFPLEELHYEYNYDIDPSMLNISLADRAVTVSLSKGGALKFLYGQSPLVYNFSQNGIWHLTFNESWTGITNATRLGDLAADRKYLQLVGISNIGVDGTQKIDQPIVFRGHISTVSTTANLSTAVFYWNASGIMALQNTMPLSGSTAWSNNTNFVPDNYNGSGYTIAWYIWVNDTDGNTGQTNTQYTYFAGEEPTTFSDTGTNTTVAGDMCLFCTFATAGGSKNLSYASFRTNNTGSWVNTTYQQLYGNSSWANFTSALNPTDQAVVAWEIWVKDTDGYWWSTGTQTLTTFSLQSIRACDSGGTKKYVC